MAQRERTYSAVIEERFFNRDLSWLAFNERVLAMAREEGIPLLERVKFLAIFSSNLDEFFQVRVASLKNKKAAGATQRSADGRDPQELDLDISDTVHRLVAEQEALLREEILPELKNNDIVLQRWEDVSAEEKAMLSSEFEQRIFPILTPLVVDPAHPFPYVSGLALSIAVMLRDPINGEERFARLKVPPLLPRFLKLNNSQHFIPIEEVIIAHLPALFEGMEVQSATTFRVSRDADLDVDDEEAEDLLEAIEAELIRRRFGRAVRLEVRDSIDETVLQLLIEEFEVENHDVYKFNLPLDLTSLFAISSLPVAALRDVPWPAVTAGRLAAASEQDRSIFSVIRERDLLVHHPYESFVTSTQAFIEEAANDPRVQSIKMTLYRTSGDSPIAQSLIRAAERGVQVVALIELKARFDEAVNVTWAKQLERAGVHVMYGIVGLKTHVKCALVVREDGDGLRRYVHFGTGNYNSKTAGLYEDLAIFTCNPELASDASRLFNHLTGFSRNDHYQHLLVAPNYLKSGLIDLIRQEARAGQNGYIRLKLNSLADSQMMEALYEASEAGVKIDIIVRGICGIRPGVPGMSSNITVRSILGRYLEHSRIYMFGNGNGPGVPRWYIGSADLMSRNLDRRVEALVPVLQEKHQQWCEKVLSDLSNATAPHFVLNAAGNWAREGDSFALRNAQEDLYVWAKNQQERRNS
ncbi:MAG: polyphosphate kinase 1 [bacterium]